MNENQMFMKLNALADLVKVKLPVYRNPSKFYFDRDIFEYTLLKKIVSSIIPNQITVIGGYTCLDLFCATEGIRCDFKNYDPLEHKWAKTKKEFEEITYILKKYFRFQGSYSHYQQFIESAEQIIKSKVVMINVPAFDIKQFTKLNGEDRPDVIILSHYSKIEELSKTVQNDLHEVHSTIPLRYVTPQMLIFSVVDLDSFGKENYIEYDKDFFGIKNIGFINHSFSR